MRIYEPKSEMYLFKYLPDFAGFILTNHLEDFVRDQLQMSRELNLPLLKYLSNYNDEQLIALSKVTTAEYLGYLKLNQAKEQLETSFTKWLKNQLEVIGKYDIVAEDITALNHIRAKLFKKWVRRYPVELDHQYALVDEIDDLFFGATTSALNTYIDILKHKIDEESHLNVKMINTSPGIIFIFDLVAQRELYVNGNVNGILGYSLEEVLSLGSSIMPNLTHPDDLQALNNLLTLMQNDKSGQTHQLEYRFKEKGGHYKWLRSYLTVFKRDENGYPTQLIGTSFEITKEKEITLALAKRESQLLEAQQITKIGSFEWDLITNQSVNTPQLMEIFEFDDHQSHEEFMQNVHPADKALVEKAIAESFQTGAYDNQYRYLCNGREKVLWARGVVHFKNGQAVLMRGTVQDITKLKSIEAELTRKTRELEKSNESLQQFASIASHDLKEPLRKMSMYTDMVLTTEEKNISSSSQKNLAKVKSSSIRMQNMIEDILDFSSIKVTGEKAEVSLSVVVKEVLEILDDAIAEKSAIINCDALPTTKVAPAQMRQLFLNLIANSLKFSKPDTKPVINITYRYTNSDEIIIDGSKILEIKVSDNGIGFDQEYSGKIFDLFTRLHSRSAYEGSGLGLSICKKIVENHGGVITAESSPGHGATFVIQIPVSRN